MGKPKSLIYVKNVGLFREKVLGFWVVASPGTQRNGDSAQCALSDEPGIRANGVRAPLVCQLADPGCPGPDTRLLQLADRKMGSCLELNLNCKAMPDENGTKPRTRPSPSSECLRHTCALFCCCYMDGHRKKFIYI